MAFLEIHIKICPSTILIPFWNYQILRKMKLELAFRFERLTNFNGSNNPLILSPGAKYLCLKI